MFWLQSWTLQLAKCSRPPLRRLLCDARTNLPVLMLFTKLGPSWSSLSYIFKEGRKNTAKKRRRNKPADAQLNPCPLCDEAKAVLEPYKHKFILQEVDITLPDHSAWFEKYKYDIPVFHLNGQFLMKHRVDIQKLENELCKLGLQDHVTR